MTHLVRWRHATAVALLFLLLVGGREGARAFASALFATRLGVLGGVDGCGH
jgi:hypothetical protein